MTLPFENDTRAITKKYARQSIRQGRGKTLLSLLTILLSAALLSGFILCVAGMSTETQRGLLTASHMLYHDLSPEQMQGLRQDERISQARAYRQAANTQIENYLGIPVCVEQNDSQIAVEEIVEGVYPTGFYEVAVDKAYLARLGLPAQLGQEITIPFYDGTTETFTVVGLTDSGSTERVYSLYCSQQYGARGSQFAHCVTALAVQFANAQQLSKEGLEATARELEADYGIPPQNSDPNDGFFSSLDPNWEDLQIILLFSFAVLLVGYLVIYSIFYIYVHNQVREFGQLRTMGATAKQLKTIVRAQGRFFCLCGAPLGLAIGASGAFLFKPQGWSWGNTSLVSGLVLLLLYGMIWLAMSKPAKLAGRISPIAAAKHTGYDAAPAKGPGRRLTPFSFAIMGSARTRKKWGTTLLSLAVAGVLFLSGTTLLSSLDMERMARHGLLEYGEFSLTLSRNAQRNDPHGQTGLQKDNPLDRDLIQTIQQLDGVAAVTPYQALEARFSYRGVSQREDLVPFTQDEQALLEQYLTAGTAEYASMAENGEILVLRNEYAQYVYDWTFQVGDTVTFRWYNGTGYQEAAYRIAGALSDELLETEAGGKGFATAGFFLLPQDLLEKMMPSVFNLNTHLLVSMEDLSLEPGLREAMQDLADITPGVTMESLYDLYQDSRAMYRRASLVIWGLCGSTMLFALLNLINTLIATTLSRRHEFSLLRAIGMEKRQLRRTIQWEGILLAAWNAGVTAVLGTAAGYGIVRRLNSMGDDTWVWRFPGPYLVGYGVAAVLLPLLISAVILHFLEKKTVVEQLREINCVRS